MHLACFQTQLDMRAEIEAKTAKCATSNKCIVPVLFGKIFKS